MTRKHKLCLCIFLLVAGLSTINDAKTALETKGLETYNKLKDKIEIYEVKVESVNDDNTLTFTIDDMKHKVVSAIKDVAVGDKYIVYTTNQIVYYSTIDDLVEAHAGKGFHRFMLRVGYAFCLASAFCCIATLTKKR